MSCVMKKGEVLIYSTSHMVVTDNVKLVGFPLTSTVETNLNQTRVSFRITNLPSNFIPVMMSFYGKDMRCKDSLKFNINFQSFNNSLNRSNLINEADGTKTFEIFDTSLTNFGTANTGRAICSVPELISKIVVVYNDC